MNRRKHWVLLAFVAMLVGALGGLGSTVVPPPQTSFAATFQVISWRAEDGAPGINSPLPLFYTAATEGKRPTGPWAPGDSWQRTLTVQNPIANGTAIGLIKMQATDVSNPDLARLYTLTVDDGAGQTLYKGTLADLTVAQPFAKQPSISPGRTVNLNFTVALDPATPNQYQGATVTANFVITAGGCPPGGCCTGNCGPTRAFEVTKLVSATNDPATGQATLSLQGGTAYYFYTVKNTGETVLTIDSAVDDKLGNLTFNPQPISPGHLATATVSRDFPVLGGDVPAQTETNTVTVSAHDSDGPVGMHQASATVTNVPVNPDFQITKTVSQTDNPAAGVKALTLPGSATVYYFFTLTNTGNVPLQITSAVDDKLGPVSFSPNPVPAGATATARISAPVTQDEISTITVTTQFGSTQVGPKQASVQIQIIPVSTGSITVRVLDNSAWKAEAPYSRTIPKPIPDVAVTLQPGGATGTQTLTTDSQGLARFANLTPGTYTATVTNVADPDKLVATTQSGSGQTTLAASANQVVTIPLTWAPPTPTGSRMDIEVALCDAFAARKGAVTLTGPDGAPASGGPKPGTTNVMLYPGLNPGTFTATVSGGGLAAPVSKSVTLVRSTQDQVYQIDLSDACGVPPAGAVNVVFCSVKQRGATIAIQGTGPNGQTVTAETVSDNGPGHFLTQLFQHLAAGTWTFTVNNGTALAPKQVEVTAGNPVTLQIETACTGAPMPPYYLYGGLLVLAGGGLLVWRRRKGQS